MMEDEQFINPHDDTTGYYHDQYHKEKYPVQYTDTTFQQQTNNYHKPEFVQGKAMLFTL